MKILKMSLVFVLVTMVLSVSAQNKKVAVVTFGANKYIGTSNLAGGPSLVASVGALANDSNFRIKPILDKFYHTFFEEYSKGFPFDLLPESEVINNEQYKNYTTIDTGSFFRRDFLQKEGYKFLEVSVLYKADLKKMIEIFPNADGFMFINLTFEFKPKMAIGGMGTAGIEAYASIKIWNKEAKKVVNIYESSSSKSSVSMVAGIPIVKVDKILPLCQEAADQLLVDLQGKLPKIVKKSAKNL